MMMEALCVRFIIICVVGLRSKVYQQLSVQINTTDNGFYVQSAFLHVLVKPVHVSLGFGAMGKQISYFCVKSPVSCLMSLSTFNARLQSVWSNRSYWSQSNDV